jgi:RecJ-like exonuclease
VVCEWADVNVDLEAAAVEAMAAELYARGAIGGTTQWDRDQVGSALAAVLGTTVNATCEKCKGTGTINQTDRSWCWYCGGSGKVLLGIGEVVR